MNPKYIKWFSEIGIEDIALVGGKNASLGETYRELTPRGVSVPNGFAITAQGLSAFSPGSLLGSKDPRPPQGTGYA